MPRYLLLQVRDHDDPMRSQEVRCFARALGCPSGQILVHDLLRGGAELPPELCDADVLLFGGSGDYSVAEGGAWLADALRLMRGVVDSGKPTFASCWGFQAMARALGGTVVKDVARAEVGTVPVTLTEAGRRDPLFGTLPPRFDAQMGHQDRVVTLPAGAVRLASSDKVIHQAFALPGKPIYCTQFHPELTRHALLERVRAYPQYLEQILGVTLKSFEGLCHETPESNLLLPRFVEQSLGEVLVRPVPPEDPSLSG